MTKSDREAIRLFYQSIPTQEEKDLFYSIITTDSRSRAMMLVKFIQETGADVSDDLMNIMLVASLTKEDRIMIFSGVARQLIFKILSFLGL